MGMMMSSNAAQFPIDHSRHKASANFFYLRAAWATGMGCKD